MSAMFELPLSTETLSDEEVTDISGCSRKNDQVDWLTKNGWIFFKNRAGAPKIGRLYARLRMAGINPATLVTPAAGGWSLDTSKVR
jgi:hypothetical protein